MSFGLYYVVYCIYGYLHPNYVLCVGFGDLEEISSLKWKKGAWNCMILEELREDHEELEDSRERA